ncbi:hypothetical protein L484_027921 [Morus notabilis]|uniref:VQ domain-containing protein n=1 Tax=Morus notabilis TaxID=981085 RepID=W9S7K8_9ROSA|nr:calmodulin-binding protein 25 [Morus notabilis]EXC30746.1 hypothetical protein L484_027921 [Morus notabilis]
MASSENLASIDPWAFRPTFSDCWLSELFARDTETLTKALQKSLEPVVAPSSDSDIFRTEQVQTPTPTVSGLSGSDPDTPSSAAASTKRHRLAIPPKVSKRKSRATKRSQTTFITADPANFRQMVQQVTGVRFRGVAAQFGSAAAPILKPEPQRACGARFPVAGACLPTLDTSALLLDHHSSHQSQQGHPVGSTTAMASLVGAGSGSAPTMVSSFVEAGSGGLDFDAFPSFPTLESWKVM